MKKILIIEDDRDIAELVEYNLTQERYDVDKAESGARGLSLARRGKPDLIILDLMLPDIGGFDVCRTLKEDDRTRDIPVVILTAKGEEVDRIVGFEVGADDFVTKPFSPRELILRVKAVLRRKAGGAAPAEVLPTAFGVLRVDPSKFEVTVGKKEIVLTATEFKLLEYLLATRGRVATRESLLDRVWGYDSAITTRTVDTHIKRLREKLGQASAYIETIRGVGYRFLEHPDKR